MVYRPQIGRVNGGEAAFGPLFELQRGTWKLQKKGLALGSQSSRLVGQFRITLGTRPSLRFNQVEVIKSYDQSEGSQISCVHEKEMEVRCRLIQWIRGN
jgi:hypothetical protein